ncbi:MAG: hypothetical protein JWM16_5038 [Verrucomicrobiales bacterium]|nr:hypothetical protein [Verrucomicrobiales bacterium]
MESRLPPVQLRGGAYRCHFHRQAAFLLDCGKHPRRVCLSRADFKIEPWDIDDSIFVSPKDPGVNLPEIAELLEHVARFYPQTESSCICYSCLLRFSEL